MFFKNKTRVDQEIIVNYETEVTGGDELLFYNKNVFGSCGVIREVLFVIKDTGT
jgi:hypothetical protein